MNKKLVLSVLSTAVVASMAASAMAKPNAGFYVGGNVDKYYSIDAFINHLDTALDEILDNLDSTTFVDENGKAAPFLSALNAQTEEELNAVTESARLDHFEKNPYTIVDGTGSYNPEEDEDLLPPVDGGELKVESVSAINASQIEVKFGAAVEKKSAEAPDNYSLESYVGTKTPKLVDSKTVVLTLDPAAVASLQQETKTLTVANIKSATDATKKIPNFSGKVSFLDLTVPQAVEAKLIGPGKVQVFFSEPVQADAGKVGFLVDGGQYSVTVEKYDAATKSVILQTGSLTLGNHTITVNPDGDKAVKDGAGLYVAKTDVPLTVAEDTTAPVLVSGTVNSQTEVVLTFDEPITGLSKEAVYHTANIPAYQATSVEPVEGTNDKQWKVTFSNPLPTGTLTLYVAKEAVQDNFGNKNSQILSTTVSVVADTTKPSVTELKVVSAKSVTLAFSEDVVGADSKANYKVTDKDGKLVAGYSVSYNQEEKKATINFSPALKEGATYNIEVTGIKDKAVVPNEMDTFTTSFTVADTTAPVVSENGLYDKQARKITIFFSEAMNGTDLLDKSKYTLAAGTTQVELPADAVPVVGPNNTSVSITLPAEVKDRNGNNIVDQIDKVIVGQLRDLAGNKTAKVYTDVSLGVAAGQLTSDNVVEGSATTVDSRTVQFALNKPLKSIVASDFVVGDKKVEFAKYENKTLADGKTYGSVVTLQVAAKDAWNTDFTPEIKTASVTKSESVYGDKFAADATLASDVADGVAPALADANKDGKTDYALKVGSKGVESVTVSFTEALKQSTVSVEDFEVPGYSVADVKLVENNTKVEIVLNPAAERGTSFKVRFVGSVSDTAGNVFAGNGAEITISAEDNPVNKAPVAKTGLDQTVVEGAPAIVLSAGDLATDADQDTLTLANPTSDDTAVATVALNGNGELEITPVAAGMANISVEVTDGTDTITVTFTVTVDPAAPVNNPPTGSVADQSEATGTGPWTIDLAAAITDPDGDTITFSNAGSSDTGVATVSLTGSTLTVTEVGQGTTTITVDYDDGKGGTGTLTFDFTITP
ncbi:Ig-like domain-containing protein [Brevibacillus thermoruber]|uniref:Ig-like domain-containing protein n=1 Tax=Brevibacillus thermoruber TaxID=33942 RepID=A0A9X3TP36_9BACL|nr:Ig-like domain-containing protein [Brevibacillus thermoruber]MDA5108119.1 Ig-like domain-containing protein [Brevibacillus thermoruber]